jgi:hypothetical protein
MPCNMTRNVTSTMPRTMTRKSAHWIATATAFLLFATLAHAQGQPGVTAPLQTPATQAWAESQALFNRQSLYHGNNLLVVTAARPTHRQKCRVESFANDQLVCASSHSHKPRVYGQQDILDLITPGQHTPTLLYVLSCATAGAGAITGAVFLASISIAAAVPVAIIGGALLAVSPLLAVLGYGDAPGRVLYQQPGTTLKVALR